MLAERIFKVFGVEVYFLHYLWPAGALESQLKEEREETSGGGGGGCHHVTGWLLTGVRPGQTKYQGHWDTDWDSNINVI